MSDARDWATTTVVAQSYSGAIARIVAEHKTRLLNLARALGASKLELEVTDDDGTVLGTVSLRGPRVTAAITDEAAFLAWVQDRYDTEIVTVEAVRPAFRTRVLDHAKNVGDAVDPDTGEIIPGVTVTIGDPHLAVTPTTAAHRRADDLVRAGQPPQLPYQGEGDDTRGIGTKPDTGAVR